MVYSPTIIEDIPLKEARRGRLHPPKDVRPSFADRTILVTGANTGLGFEAALKFVSCGASKVILGVRSLQRGRDAKQQIERRTGRTGVVDCWELDMSDYNSIRTFSQRISTELERLDVAVLNAGMITGTYHKSQYGCEQTIQINTVSTALLAVLLLPKLRSSKTAAEFAPVLQLVSSGSHYTVQKLASDGDAGILEIYSRRALFDTLTNYCVSKLILEYVRTELARLAISPTTGKPNVIVVSVCPGAARSQLARGIKSPLMRLAWQIASYILERTTEEGARSYISAVVQGEEGHGKFWQNDVFRDPSPLLVGEENELIRKKVWNEIVESLRKEVPEIGVIVGA